jgi:hypothetical protein
MTIKLLVIGLCNSRFIHSNHVYFFVRLHHATAQLLWAIAIFCLYRYGLSQVWSPDIKKVYTYIYYYTVILSIIRDYHYCSFLKCSIDVKCHIQARKRICSFYITNFTYFVISTPSVSYDHDTYAYTHRMKQSY